MRKARAKKTDTNNNNNRDLPSTNLILIPFSSLQWGAYLSTNLQYKYYNCIWYNQQQVQLPRCSTLNKINLRIQPTRESNSLRCLPQNRFWSWAWRYWWTGWIKRTFCSRSCGLVAVGWYTNKVNHKHKLINYCKSGYKRPPQMSILIKILAVFKHEFWSTKNPDCNAGFDQNALKKRQHKKIRNHGSRPWEGCSKMDTNRDLPSNFIWPHFSHFRGERLFQLLQ